LFIIKCKTLKKITNTDSCDLNNKIWDSGK